MNISNLSNKTILIFLGLSFLTFFLQTSKAQNFPKKFMISNCDTVSPINVDSIHQVSLGKKHSCAFSLAMLAYPELWESNIVLKKQKIKTSMAARPTFFSLFRAKTKRKYLVLVNDSPKHQGASPDSIPFNALVGVYAHELAHVWDYYQSSGFRVFWIGISYLFPKTKRKLEFKTDKETIRRGFGWQVYDFSDYIWNKANVSEKYRNYKKRFYMSPGMIKQLLLVRSYEF